MNDPKLGSRHRGRALVAVVTFSVAVMAASIMWQWRTDRTTSPVRVPELSAEAQAGKRGFDLHCARCHGADGGGSPTGPPLVHRTYRPAHHPDVAFELAVRRGVRAHHWRFGDMPPAPAVSGAEVARITRYVRELQRANGIE